jgi:hypothetical protein
VVPEVELVLRDGLGVRLGYIHANTRQCPSRSHSPYGGRGRQARGSFARTNVLRHGAPAAACETSEL